MKEIHGDRQVTANQFIKEREYWIKQFSGEWSTGAFPYDYREGGPPRTGGETIDLPIPPGLTGALAKVTRGSDPRLHIVLTAGLAVLLRKYTRDNAATLGTTIDKQDAGGAGTAQFTNTVLALRCPVSDPMTFKEVILGVRQTIIEAIENQNYPIEALLNQLNLETNPETTPPGFPLFDVALLLENLHDRTYLGHINPGLIFSFLRTDEGEGGGMAISGTLEYNPALYTEGTVRRIGRHFTCLLARLLSDMDRPNAGIPLLTDDEQKELIHDFNATRAPYPGEKTIHQLFGEQAQRTPEAVAVRTFNAVDTDAGPGLTYRELDEESDRLAARLRDEGLCPGTIVAVHAGRRPGTITAILGVLKAGAAYLPIDPAYPDQRIEYMLADSGAAVMVDGDNALRTTGVAATGVANAAAYVLYTSGSTGRPRGVLVEHRALTAYIWWVAELLGSGGGKIKPLNLPLYTSVGFDLTVTSIFTPLVTGGSVVVYGGGEGGGDEDKEALIRRVMGNPDLDAVKLTPSHLKLLRARGLPDNAPDHLIVGGENLERDLVEEIYATPGKKPFIHNEYGPTEAVVGCMVHRFDPRQDKGKSVPLGVPAANTRIYLLDPHGQPVPPGVGGEIYIAGDGLARGYLNDPGATARCFVADPFFKGERMYRSGDLAVRHGDGSIEFLGRIDHQVKIRGHRVETGEIGARLREADGVADALVIAGTRRDGTNYLGAYLVPVPGEPVDTARIRQFLHRYVPDYMVPDFIVPLDAFPLTTNGKVDHDALPKPESLMDNARSYVAPRDEIEQKLVGIWAGVLEMDSGTVGIDDSFFELGGHSLNATVIIAEIQKQLDAVIPMEELFASPTIRGISEFIKNAPVGRFDLISPTEKKEYYPQSSAQKRLFFLDHFEGIGTSYNIPCILSIEGPFDPDRCRAAVAGMVRRHETLRTAFMLLDNEPVQVIRDTAEVRPREMVPPADGEDALDIKAIIREFVRPFDLSRAPLLRVAFLRLSEQKHLLLYDMHHIISDGASRAVLQNDFVKLYDNEPLAPLEIQYKDFAVWQTDLLETGKIAAQEQYWRSVFPDPHDIPKLNLPTDYVRPAVFSFEGDDYEFHLDARASGRFKQVGARSDATLFMNLLAAYNVLLFKYTGDEDIVIGCDIAGRAYADLQPVIGMFVNELAMRSYPNGTKTYQELLGETKKNSIKAFDNQDYQFEELVDRLNLDRDPSRNPLFDVEFSLFNFDRRGDTLEDITITPYTYDAGTTKFDIALDAYEKDDEIHFRFEYCTRLYKPRTIEAMARHFIHILDQVSVNPDVSLYDITMITPREKEQILFEFNNTQRDFPGDCGYPELFRNRVREAPDRIAVGHRDHLISYALLDHRSGALGRYLRQKGTGPGVMVGICMDRSIHSLPAILGIMKTGGVYVPIDPQLPGERIKTTIQDAEINVVVTTRQYAPMMEKIQWECRSFHSMLLVDPGTEITASFSDGETETNYTEGTRELWDYIAAQSTDDITRGGWMTSYTGEPFSRLEMDEYGDNILEKLKPLLHDQMKVLEIGCASGITMYRIAPHVAHYHGTDISPETIKQNEALIKNHPDYQKHRNITLQCLPANRLHRIGEKHVQPFDLVVINSVIQSFRDHDYLRNVLNQALELLAPGGHIFIGDVMDLERKSLLEEDMLRYRRDHRHKPGEQDGQINTKIDWSTELFIARDFFRDFVAETPGITGAEFSDKIHTIENELTKFRYDVMLTAGKKSSAGPAHRHKYRDVLSGSPGDDDGLVVGGPEDPAYVIYTSGTTGRPKGVVIHRRGMINHLDAKINDLGITHEDIIAQTAPVSFDISLWQFLAAPLKGGRTFIIDKNVVLEPPALRAGLLRGGVTILESVPSLMTVFLDGVSPETEGDSGLGQLRWMIPTGEPLTPHLVRKWYRQYPQIKLLNAYGPTEASDDVTHYRVDRVPPENQPTIPIGKPLQNLHIYILDKNLSLCPVGVRGEICVAGVGVGKGYWKDRQKTAAAFVPNPLAGEFPGNTFDTIYDTIYRTGDMGYYREDGHLECLGRIDFQVKIRGNRVELGEIESLLRGHEEVIDAVVTVISDENGDAPGGGDGRLCAYYLSPAPLGTEDLREHLGRELPDYMIPGHFVRLEEIPLTTAGKVDRKALPLPVADGTAETHAPPRSPVEKKLRDIWADVLNMPPQGIGIDDNFFELGGHSLRATVMVSRARKELDLEIPISRVFQVPTIRGLVGQPVATGPRNTPQHPMPHTAVEAAEKRDYYPLSPSQRRLYILYRLDPGSTAYNMPMIRVLEGDPDPERFGGTFKALIQRHASLRTSFRLVNGEPVQRVEDTVEFDVQHDDRCGGDEIHAGFVGPFDLSRAPLLRVSLVKTGGPGKYILMVDMHHIISDGISHGVLARDFLLHFSGRALPAIRLQYVDFALWQEKLRVDQPEHIGRQRDFWLEEFAGAPPFTGIPTDYPRPPVRTSEGRRMQFTLDAGTADAVRDLCRQTGATLYMVLLAALKVLLARYCNREDVVVGSVGAGRGHPDLQQIIGMFVNTFAVRTFPAPTKSFYQFLDEVKAKLLKTYENQDYPFEGLVNKLGMKMDANRNPLFDVLFLLQNFEREADKISDTVDCGLTLRPYPHRKQTAIFDMTWFAVERGDEVEFTLEYSTSLFKEETIARISRDYKKILEAVIDNNHIQIGDIKLGEQELAVLKTIPMDAEFNV